MVPLNPHVPSMPNITVGTLLSCEANNKTVGDGSQPREASEGLSSPNIDLVISIRKSGRATGKPTWMIFNVCDVDISWIAVILLVNNLLLSN